jgi:creatinine amidohydrolase
MAWRTPGLAVLSTALCLLVAPCSATKAADRSVFLEELTWTELGDLVKAGTKTIIVPIGGTEQSGPAIALGKHNVRVKFLAEKIARQLGDALVAPVIAYVPEGTIDPPSGHMQFPGTITVSDKSFEDMLESAARSFELHGFRTIVLIGDHGGYQKDEEIVADRLNRAWAHDKARVFAALAYYDLAQQPYAEKLEAAGIKASEIGTHAGLADTSLTLAVDPSMVRLDRIAAGPKFTAADGVYGGDPTRSSAALGQLGVDLVVSGTVRAIRDFRQQSTK